MAAAKTKARIDVKYLAEQLLNCRLEAGLNQAEAAAKIGVAPSNYFIMKQPTPLSLPKNLSLK